MGVARAFKAVKRSSQSMPARAKEDIASPPCREERRVKGPAGEDPEYRGVIPGPQPP